MQMKQKISVRQICFIMFAYTAASKLVSYPTGLSLQSGRDLLFPALFSFIVQGIIIWAVSFLCSRTDKTFFELLENTFGEVTARIIFGFFAVFFVLCTIIPLFEQKLYVHAIFYDTIPALDVFIPFFFFSVYACCKGFQNIGRCADVCFPLFIVSMVFILAMSVPEADFSAFLPVFKTPFKNIAGGAVSNVFRFYEPCWLLMFMGRFKYKRGDTAKITLSYAGGTLFVLLTAAVFYGIYGDLAQARQFPISKISLYFPAIETVGRIDLIALYVLEVVMLFSLVLNIQMTAYCVRKCTGYKNTAVISVVLNAGLMIFIIFFDNKISALHMLWSSWMGIAFIVFANVLPVLAWALRRKDNAV